MRLVYLNGKYLPDNEARISIFDRGFLFGDGVYEVTSVLAGKLLEFQPHMQRLERSLQVTGMGNPLSRTDWLAAHHELLKRNRLTDGQIYVQVTRGDEGDRSFLFPPADISQTVVMFTQERPLQADNPKAKTGVRVISVPDIRWGRRDIKSVQLMAAAMAKSEARQRSADDAWLVQDGFVTEGSSNNTFIVADGRIITRALSNDILHGTTRAALLRCATENGLQIEERPFTIAEAQNADEAFFSSAGDFIMPVVEIDGKQIGTGLPGRISIRLRQLYIEQALREGV